MTCYGLDAAEVLRLLEVGKAAGIEWAELAALDRLHRFAATGRDVVRLCPLARRAGLPWRHLFPGVPGLTCSAAGTNLNTQGNKCENEAQNDQPSTSSSGSANPRLPA